MSDTDNSSARSSSPDFNAMSPVHDLLSPSDDEYPENIEYAMYSSTHSEVVQQRRHMPVSHHNQEFQTSEVELQPNGTHNSQRQLRKPISHSNFSNRDNIIV